MPVDDDPDDPDGFDPRYVVCKSLRYVAPYDKTLRARVTARRSGSLLDVLKNQIGTWSGFQTRADADDATHWGDELDRGRVRVVLDATRALPVGGEPTESMWTRPGLADETPAGSLVEYVRHVHERVVASAVPRIIHEDDAIGLVVVEKPGGVPCHAGVGPGWEGYNNAVRLVGMSTDEKGTLGKRRRSNENDDESEERDDTAGCSQRRVWAVNRIDAPVSGVWLCATSTKACSRLQRWMQKADSRGKTYLARVYGALETPDDGLVIDVPLVKDKETSLALVRPLSEGGKPCRTRVYALERSKTDDTTLVAVQLELHGRYHQIRAHLRSIGHPIANDDAYNDVVPQAERTPPTYAGTAYDDDESGTLRRMLESRARDDCPECTALLAAVSDGHLHSTLQPAGKSIWLHALRYTFSVDERVVDCSSKVLPTFAAQLLPEASRTVDAVLARIPSAKPLEPH
jgi:23S rRNA-/tRNA-specific pseudouridylate synthase